MNEIQPELDVDELRETKGVVMLGGKTITIINRIGLPSQLSNNEVLVKIHAGLIGPEDILELTGNCPTDPESKICGLEGSGTIVKTGKDCPG